MIVGNQDISIKNIGGKAYNLLELDKKLSVPSFVVLSSSVFRAHIKKDKKLEELINKKTTSKLIRNNIRKRILNLDLDSNTIKRIEEYFKKQKSEYLIVRSSFVEEDSMSKSYAGIFSSYKTDKKNFASKIKLVWASLYSEKAFSYSGKMDKIGGMAVVIQKYVKGDYSGVIFLQKDSVPEVYLEYSNKSNSSVVDGTINPEFAFKVLNNRDLDFYFKSKNKNEESWLESISIDTAEFFNSTFMKGDLDIEFIVKDNKINYVQVRPMTKKASFNNSYFCFDRNFRWGYNAEDFSKSRFKQILKSLDLVNIPDFKTENDVVFFEMNSFFKFIEELYEKSMLSTFVENFVNIFSKLVKKEYIISKKSNINSPITLIKALKDIKFTMSIMDFMNNQIRIAQINFLKSKYKIKEDAKYLSLLAPPISFASEKFLIDSQSFLNEKLFTEEESKKMVEKINFKKVRENVKKNHKKVSSLFSQMNKIKKEYFLMHKKIIWLKDFVDYYYDKTETNYFHQLESSCQKRNIYFKNRSSLEKVTILKLANIKKMINQKRLVISSILNKTKNEKKDKEVKKFPLKGVVASVGDFSGQVKIIRNIDDIKSLTSNHVLVAEYTKPSLVVGMAIAKGIITECGGITCHAAIVSREIGKPCLIAVEGCTRFLSDGDYVVVKNGNIYKK